jgi:hypothetical protein
MEVYNFYFKMDSQSTTQTRPATAGNKLPEMPSQQPNVDTRVKTEDVTNTKGLSFRDFNLGKDIQLVCK